MSETWRLILNGPAHGTRNMALDEAILETASRGEALPTLRLYAWEPACLSLGHAQPVDVVDFDGLRAQGWDWVRRPTGGRALLHTDEITYAVIASAGHPGFTGGVLASYQFLSRGLRTALVRLGLTPDPPAFVQPSPANRANPVCFEVPSAYELTVGGRKIVGSAQLRRRGAVLQHGSLPLRGDITRVTRALRFPGPAERETAAERLERHATTLEGVLRRAVSWEQASEALIDGFAEALGVRFDPQEVSEEEAARAARLEAERPVHDAASQRVTAG